MKNFIYTFVLLAGIQFAQAQRITGIVMPNGLPWGEVSIDILASPAGFINVIAVMENSGEGATPLEIGDTVGIEVEVNGHLTGSYSVAMAIVVGVNTQAGIQMPVNLVTKYMWEGENEFCILIPYVVVGGVKREVKNPSFCEKITIGNIENPDNSVAEAGILGAMQIYPNPVNDQLKIRNAAEAVSVEIYSITGQLIKTTEVVGDADIDMSNVANGIYFVKMRNGNHIRTEKIQVVK
jgi:hypothetical protein